MHKLPSDEQGQMLNDWLIGPISALAVLLVAALEKFGLFQMLERLFF